MKTPQQRDPVIQQVPVIKTQIQQEKSNQEFSPSRQGKQMNQTKRFARGPGKHLQRRGTDSDSSDKKRQGGETGIDEQSGEQPGFGLTQGKNSFDQKEQGEQSSNNERRERKYLHG